jgi:hypothetical protein
LQPLAARHIIGYAATARQHREHDAALAALDFTV